MGILLLVYSILETYLLVRVGAQVGIVNTLFALVAAGILGAGLAKTQGRYILASLQAGAARGEPPTSSVLHGLMVFIAGILFILPGFISDIVGLLLLFPGTRHMMVALVSKRMKEQMRTGNYRAFTFGSFGSFGGAFGTGMGTGPGKSAGAARGPKQQPEWERDVSPKVIDIQPLKPKDGKKPGPNDSH